MYFVLAFSLGLVLAKVVVSAPAESKQQEYPAGVFVPPPSATTNESGAPVYRIPTTPVITNNAALTNELASLEARDEEIDRQIKQIALRQDPVQGKLEEVHSTMNSYATNYVPKDEEGLALKEQIRIREEELKDLKSKLARKMEADSEYQESQKTAVQTQQEWRQLTGEKQSLLKEKRSVATKIRQIRTLMERTEREQKEQEGKTKGENGPKNKP